MDILDTEWQEAFFIWYHNGHRQLNGSDIEELIGDFEKDYICCYDTEEDFAQELIAERENLRDFARQYFDTEAYTCDLFSFDYWSLDRYVFYNQYYGLF